MRQDRNREAVELLNGFLATTEDAEARALLARIQHDSAAEKSLSEAKLAHFHVRYDGEAHEDVGREILRLLDRHYATLARSFDHEPGQPIPVILLSRESYYDATGAPAWSGGQYDSFDGRVRIPIGGLSAALTPELDQTLVHELTHSFVNDLSGGAAPRELHEGLAQYMEGRRIAQLDSDRLRALANGQLAGVARLLLRLALAGGGPRRPARARAASTTCCARWARAETWTRPSAASTAATSRRSSGRRPDASGCATAASRQRTSRSNGRRATGPPPSSACVKRTSDAPCRPSART